MGILTQYIFYKTNDLFLLEIDKESIKYLHLSFSSLKNRIIHIDLLQNKPILSLITIIGNIPYNISSRILFFLLKYKKYIYECVGMFQTEITERIFSTPKNKDYGMISVLLQTFYNIEYIFTISSNFLLPNPKIKSSVIHIYKKYKIDLDVNESIIFNIIKLSFFKRRKILRNTLKTLKLSNSFYQNSIFYKRAEQLSAQDFITLSYYNIII